MLLLVAYPKVHRQKLRNPSSTFGRPYCDAFQDFPMQNLRFQGFSLRVLRHIPDAFLDGHFPLAADDTGYIFQG